MRPTALLALALLWPVAGENLATALPEPGVVLRGNSGVSGGDCIAVNAQGVTVVRDRDPSGKPTRTAVLSWDQVKLVQGPLQADAQAFEVIADKAWRARSRLERGDLVAAEPIFEDLFHQYAQKAGPTTAVIAGGLLRCRLARGAQTAAVQAWLSWVLATGSSVSASNPADALPESVGAEVSRLVDPATGLSPSLPPLWLSTTAVQVFASSDLPPSDRAKGTTPSEPARSSLIEERVRTLLELYVQSARADCGLMSKEPAKLPDIPASSDVGVRVVADMLRARLGEPPARKEARKALTERLNAKTPPWLQAWCRVAIGRSLLAEPDVEQQRMGVVTLLIVASRSSPTDAYINGLALADAVLGLAKLGDDAGAALLAGELADRFAGHPALESPLLAKWTNRKKSSTPPKPVDPPAAPTPFNDPSRPGATPPTK